MADVSFSSLNEGWIVLSGKVYNIVVIVYPPVDQRFNTFEFAFRNCAFIGGKRNVFDGNGDPALVQGQYVFTSSISISRII